MAADPAAIRVDGLAELRRAFGRMSKELQDNLRDGLKDAAGIVAVEAKDVARREGLIDTGKLIKSIRPGTSGATGLVRANAARSGYRYGAIYEYGNQGKRAFLRPALDSKSDEVADEIGDVLDELHEQTGRFRGPDG